MVSMPRKLKNKLPPLPIGNETFGNRLARIRKERGFTQVDLAHKIGINQALISAYECGIARMNAEMILRIALVLGVSTDLLLGLEKSPQAEKKISRKVLRRMEKIEALPPHHQRYLFTMMDTYLKGINA
jgi:transcriptional regulator with XRE-family HTH domain